MNQVEAIAYPAAAVVLIAWAASTLVPALQRWRLRLTAATAVAAVLAVAAGGLALTSDTAPAILVAAPVALLALLFQLLVLLVVFAAVVHRLVVLTRLLAGFRAASRRLQAGDPAGAEVRFRRLAETAAGSRSIEVGALTNLGAALSRQGRYAEARAPFEAALALTAGRGGRRRLPLYNLAWVAFMERDFATAAARLRESQAAGPGRRQLQVLVAMLEARLAYREGAFDRAAGSLATAAAAAARIGDPEWRAWVDVQLGILDYLRGNQESGRARILAALPAHRTVEGRQLAGTWLAGLSVLAASGDREVFAAEAARLAGRDLAGEAERAARYLREG